MTRTMRHHGFADEAKAPFNGDVIFIAKAGDRNIDLGLTVCRNPGLGELHGPARICVLLCCLGRFVGPDLACRFTGFDRVLFFLRIALLGCSNERSINDLAGVDF